MIFLFIIVYGFILLILLFGILQTTRHVANQSDQPFVSIIIVAKNEEKNIKNCLLSLASQNYPHDKLEILFVDDNSADRTLAIAENLSQKFSFLKTFKKNTNLRWKSSKKAGLELARENACGEILLFTDADCFPPPSWVESMVSRFNSSTGLVAGFSPQTYKEGTLWNGFLTVDSIFSALFSAGGIGWDQGFTCTGRNFAIRASTLDNLGGYAATEDSLSGDDDFILQKISKDKNWQTTYNLDPSSVVQSSGPANFFQFIRQKQRHISASKGYNRQVQWGYLAFHVNNFACWSLFFYSFLGGKIYALPLIIKLLIDHLAIFFFAKKIGLKPRITDVVVWEFIFPVYHLVSGPLAFFCKTSWEKSVQQGGR